MGVYKKKPQSSSNKNPNQKLSKGDYWRDSYDYRDEYLKRNPGLFGCVWFCAYCGRPLFGKKQVQVDHIVPPSQFAHKKYDRHGQLIKNTSMMAETFNNGFNLVSSCAKCNRKKSDDMGLYLVRGGVAKVVQTVLFRAQDLILHTGKLTWKGCKFSGRVGKKAAKHGIRKFKGYDRRDKSVLVVVFIVVLVLFYFYFFR